MNCFPKTQKEKNEIKKVKFKNCLIDTKKNDDTRNKEIVDQLVEEKNYINDKDNINYLKTNTKNINNLKNKLKSRLKSLQKRYNTENSKNKNVIKSELIYQKVKLLEQNISQYQTEKNKNVKKKRVSLLNINE